MMAKRLLYQIIFLFVFLGMLWLYFNKHFGSLALSTGAKPSSINREWLKEVQPPVYDDITGVVLNKTGNALLVSGNSFLAEFSVSGNQNWLKQFFADDNDGKGRVVTLDPFTGDYLVAFRYEDKKLSSNRFSAYVEKYDASGNKKSSIKMGTPTEFQPKGIAAGNDSIFVSGDSNVYTYYHRIILYKLDFVGNPLWHWEYDFGQADNCGVKLDPIGNAYITGSHESAAGTVPQTRSIFLVKVNSAGQALVNVTFPVPGYSYSTATDIDIDKMGNIYLIGIARAPKDWQTGAAGFIMKIDSNGKQIYVKTFPIYNAGAYKGISLDQSGNIYITGIYDTADNKSTYYEAFLAQYDSAGNEQWLKTFKLGGQSTGEKVAVDSSGKIFVCGISKEIKSTNRGYTFVSLIDPGKIK